MIKFDENDFQNLYLIYPAREFYLAQALNVQVLLKDFKGNKVEVIGSGSFDLSQLFLSNRGETTLKASLWLYTMLSGEISIGFDTKFQYMELDEVNLKNIHG